MAPWIDARIPVLLAGAMSAGAVPGPDDVALVEAGVAGPPGVACAVFAPASGHPVGCACCAARNEAAVALTRLFLQRARGEVPFFRRVTAVIATERGEASLREALAADPLVAGRFRLG